MGLSAVCAYNLSTVEAVFSRGKYMQSATVEQSHTKWVRYNGAVPTPRPGAVSDRRLGCGKTQSLERSVGPAMLHRPCATPGCGSVHVGSGRSPGTGQGYKHTPFPVFLSLVCCVIAFAAYCPNRSLFWLVGVLWH